jgi:hypothetical protein
MTTFKTVNNDYTLTCNNGNGIFTINAQTVFNGNITEIGDTVVTYPFITVAANNTGTVHDMGLLGQTGNGSYAGLRFNTVSNTWQISSSVASDGSPVASYVDIASGNATPGGTTTDIQFNAGGVFGGSANLTFTAANNQLYLNGYQTFANTAMPATVANTVALYSNVANIGGTGLYFASTAASDELISKSRAIAYSLIF